LTIGKIIEWRCYKIINEIFENQVVIVTGAGSRRGIGRAIALAFAQEGATVVVGDLDYKGAKEVEEIIKSMGKRSLAIKLDVSNEENVNFLLHQTLDRFKRIDVLINNAGITQPIKVLDTSLENWERVINVNLTGTFLCSKAVLPYMIKNSYGRIVNMSSVSAKRGGGVFGGAHYSAAKAGILGFSKALAREVASYGITVNSIAPGVVDTDIRGDKATPEIDKEILKSIPAQRFGKVEEIAAVALFLASPGSAYITGEEIDINGGSHMD